MNAVQSNTVAGVFPAVASGDLTDKEGYLVTPTGSMSGLYPIMALVASTTAKPIYVLEDGATNGGQINVRPLDQNRQVRVKLSGSVTVGALLNAASTGKAIYGGAASDTIIGYAEESGVDGQLVKVRPIQFGSQQYPASETAGTKAAGGSDQSGATAITATITNVTAADGVKGVKLPSAVGGEHYVVANKANAILLLYPATSDQINNQSANAAIRIPPYGVAVCYAEDATIWAVTVGAEYQNGYQQVVAVSAAGTTQGDGPITAPSNAFINVTGGDGTKVVTLPVVTAGFRLEIFNNSASNLAVFPGTSGTINGGSANASVTVATKTVSRFISVDGTDWAAAEPAKA